LRTIFFATVLVALLATGARAQDDARDWNQAYDPYVGGIGLNFGASSGSGLAVRWPALPQTMFTLTGAAWGKSGEIQWDAGLEAHYILRQAGRSRLFAGPSLAFYQLDGNKDWNLGAGVGIEYLLWPRWAFKGDVSFTWMSGENSIYPLPQVGLIYYW
jgi:hypothetical protein